MQLRKFYNGFDGSTSFQKGRLLPYKIPSHSRPVSCSHCHYINSADYHFCTNCGFPLQQGENEIELYHQRLRSRNDLLQQCFTKIAHARNALYVLAGCSMLGVFYLFSDWKEYVLKGSLMVFVGIMYAGLGRWSLRKPFTSLLISLMLLLTFAAINTWTEITSTPKTASGMWLLIIQIILIYFLLQGVKGAFRADILEEEFKL